MKHYRDYIWKEGIPYGIQIEENISSVGTTYKIVADPYRKWISLEEYHDGKYSKTIYDSLLLDFRKLKPAAQNAWNKIQIKDEDQAITSLIRDHNDRVILFEHYAFEDGRCRSCTATSAFGQTLSHQKIFYKTLGDNFDGVILYDANHYPVMRKKYKVDPESDEFGELLEENWNPRSF